VLFRSRGRAVAFTSTATNLAPGDTNGQPDVYVRWMLNPAKQRFSTQLVSARNGVPGNAPSGDAVISGIGTTISYDTLASNLLAGDDNGVSDVVEAQQRGNTFRNVWASMGDGGPGNGSSFAPSMTYSGHFVSFDSNATNFEPARFQQSDPNGVTDAFFAMTLVNRVYEVSQSSAGLALARPSGPTATSARGNYIFFQSSDQLTDLGFVAERYPSMLGSVRPVVDSLVTIVKRMGGDVPPPLPTVPAQDEIYLRYLGPQ